MKYIYSAIILLILSLFAPFSVSASLVNITTEGNLEWKVLSSQDAISLSVPERTLSVKKVASGVESNTSTLQLKSNEGKVSMIIEGNFGSREMDVSKVSTEIIEIEEQFEAQKVIIGAKDDNFTIAQGGIIATTSSPLTIIPKERALALSTDSGIKYISILPKEAVESLVRPKIITHLPEWKMNLTDDPVTGPKYEIDGSRVITPFNLFSYSVPIKAEVSASTGELLEVVRPTWFSIFGFLFT